MNPGAAPARTGSVPQPKPMMKLEASINGELRRLQLEAPEQTTSVIRFAMDSIEQVADIVEVEPGVYSVVVSGRSYEVRVQDATEGYSVAVGGRNYEVVIRDPRRRSRRDGAWQAAGPRAIRAPMPGKIVRVKVAVGDTVEEGDGLIVVEAMKMQNELKAPKDGTVSAVEVEEGDSVAAGAVLVVVE